MVEEVARTPGVRRIRRRGRFGWKGLPFARLGGGPGPRPDCLDYGPLPAAALLDDNDSMAGASLETLISAERLQARVEQLGRRISADYPAHPDAPDLRLIGVLKGAFVFLSDLIRHIERDVSVDFLGVSTYGSSTESSGEVKIQKDLDHEIGGLDVVLVEDIIDTGITLNYLCDVLKQRKPRSLRIAALLDKPSRRVVEVSPSYVGFEIPDKFVVGYGLDYEQRYRNRLDICVLGE